jgi:uncharacterized membrane protein
MLILILGVLIWAFSHLMKRVTPGLRARLGDGPGKALVSVLSFVAIVLMVMGYRSADIIQVWYPPTFMRHINNLLMVIAVLLLNLGFNRGRLRALMRHPMLAAVKTWALAHLLVNGDLASIILFGGMLAWAVLNMILINKMEPAWTRPAKGPVINDVIYVVASAALFAAVVWVHTRMGYWPLG